MSKINFSARVSLSEARAIVKAIGHELTPILVAEPGIGKSSILKDLEREMGTEEYDFIYVDCPVKDMMDIAASIPNHTTKTLEYYVSTLLKAGNGKKKVVMLDEFMKSPKLMQIIWTRLMLERSWGDEQLPDGSIVFGTSNNATDGVGDAMLAHAANRVCILQVCKPDAQEWNSWASQIVPETGKPRVARTIRAWVAMNPKAMRSYLDPDQQDNEFIFKPNNGSKSFVSPRSLAKSSIIVENRDVLGENATMAALAGTIGESAARSMAAYLSVESKVIPFSQIIKDPAAAPVPDEVAVLVMMMFEAVDYVGNQTDLSAYMQYVNRIKSAEIQSIFFTMIIRSKPALARYNEAIKNWAVENHMIM